MNKNHASLSEKIDQLNQKVDDSNRAITAEIHNLEERVFGEIHKLQTSQIDQQRTINFNKAAVDDEMGQLRQELKAQQDLINNREEQIVRLERACHSGLQHNRGWNFEFEGIPSNVGEDPIQLEQAVIRICNGINVLADQYELYLLNFS